MENLLKLLPNSGPTGKLQDGVEAYLKIIGFDPKNKDVGLGNAGIKDYFAKEFKAGSCKSEMAANFYTRVSALEKRFNRNDSGPLKGRPSIGQAAGERRNSAIKKGWVWDLALKQANNNPNLAMELIGVCGHDDTNQGEVKVSRKSKYFKKNKKRLVAKLDQQIQGLEVELKKYEGRMRESKSQEIGFLKAKRDRFSDLEEPLVVPCPYKSSAFYLPESLGENITVDNTTKKRVVKVQAPTKGSTVIPAKYYHVYGSAFMGCKLKEHGVKESLIPKVQEMAAKGYRGLRICGLTDRFLSKRETLLKVYRENVESYTTRYKSIQTRRGLRTRKPSVPGVVEFYSRAIKDAVDSGTCNTKNPVCSSGLPDRFISIAPELSDIEVKDYLEKSFTLLNAAELYSEWYVGPGQLVGYKSSCTDLRLFGPRSLNVMKKKSTKRKRGTNTYNPLDGFSKKSYNRAKEKLNTWDVDFRWTVKQHIVGASFGAKKCTKFDSKKLELIACNALKRNTYTERATR